MPGVGRQLRKAANGDVAHGAQKAPPEASRIINGKQHLFLPLGMGFW